MTDFMVSDSYNSFSNNLDDENSEIQFEELIVKQNLSTEKIFGNKENATSIARQIPLQLLALEWFNKIDASIEVRAYLVENFLPILVLGCEKILKEADAKQLVQKNKKDADFNPINQLAQYLMRNNPRYNSNNETSAYVRTMREVYHELKEQMFAFQENKLAKIKADVRRRRSEREQLEKSKQIELDRRKVQLEKIFQKLLLAPNGRLEISIIYESFKLYDEHASKLPEEMRNSAKIKQNALPSVCFNRDELNLTKRILRSEFVQCMIAVTDGLSSEMFDFFIEFIEECAVYFVNLANRNKLNKILKRVFRIVDPTSSGLLVRRRIISILDSFKKTRPASQLRNPLEWPLLDPLIKFENRLDDLKNHQNTHELDEKEKSNLDSGMMPIVPPIPEISDDSIIRTSENFGDLSEPSEVVNDESGENAEATAEADSNQAEALKAQKSLTPKKLIKKVARISDEDLHTPIKTTISKDNELLFIKNAILYYKPLSDQLNAFDASLLNEKKMSHRHNAPPTSEKLYQFDPELLNEKQFISLMNAYLMPAFVLSEVLVNDFLVHLKDNYAESLAEKNFKLEKAFADKSIEAQEKKIAACFEKLDNEGSGHIKINTLSTYLDNYRDGLFKENVKQAIDKTKSEIIINNKPDDFISKDEFVRLISHLISLVDFPKFEDLVVQYLNSIVQLNYNDKSRGEQRKKWLKQIEKIGKLTYGTFEPLYKELFITLLKDSENHGNSKNISAYVGILENLNDEIALKYHASTPYDSRYLLGKTMTKSQKNVTFNVIDEGKFIHLSKVRSKSNVHFFNPDNKNDGSCAIYPLKYSRNKIFGTLGIDTLHESNRPNYFNEHELTFYQGVANTFAKAYANIVFKNRLAKTCITGIDWLSQRCKMIESCDVYFVQTLDNETRLIPDDTASITTTTTTTTTLTSTSDSTDAEMSKSSEASAKINLRPIMKYVLKNNKLEDIMKAGSSSAHIEFENNIGSNLYECAVASEATVRNFNNQTSYCIPLRNEEHKTLFILEITTKEKVEDLQNCDPDLEQIEKIVYVLEKCQEELLEENFAGITNNHFEFESHFEHEKSEILFEKRYLMHTCQSLAKFHGKKIVEYLPDGTESAESSKSRELLKLVADLVSNNKFNKNYIIDEAFVECLANFDPTLENYNFNKTTSKFKIDQEQSLKDLNELYATLGKINAPLRHLIDWVCLNKVMKDKCDQVRKRN